MADIALVAEPRNDHGSSASRRLRASGRVPGVVYGHGERPIAISVDGRALRQAFATDAGENVLFDLKIGKEKHLAMARDLQRHPIRHTIAHVDFLVVSRDEVVSAEVPLVLTGEALNVTRAGGNVDQALFTLHVKAKPADIPAHFEVDISQLELGHAIRVSEIAIPAGVTVDVDPETTVATGIAPRGLVEAETSSEEATVEEPAATEGD
ncbi:MAG TPA: 50S ribosomal protein L25 [Acidimicrobiales bacterium]|nr:50S ribosomal protein L25 [Acidimicrobiales bacterium]